MQRHNSLITNILRIKKQMREGIALRYFRTKHKASHGMTPDDKEKYVKILKKFYEHIFSMLQKHMISIFMPETAIQFLHLCICIALTYFHTLGSWMHTSKETPPLTVYITIIHYFWSTSEFKGILHGYCNYGWNESCMIFLTGTMSLQNEFFGHHGSGLGKGFHFKKIGSGTGRSVPT